eukprot:Gb_19360 [translate_table: standard]
MFARMQLDCPANENVGLLAGTNCDPNYPCPSDDPSFSSSPLPRPMAWADSELLTAMGLSSGHADTYFSARTHEHNAVNNDYTISPGVSTPHTARSIQFVKQQAFYQAGQEEILHIKNSEQPDLETNETVCTSKFWKPTWTSRVMMPDKQEPSMKRQYDLPLDRTFTESNSSAGPQPAGFNAPVEGPLFHSSTYEDTNGIPDTNTLRSGENESGNLKDNRQVSLVLACNQVIDHEPRQRKESEGPDTHFRREAKWIYWMMDIVGENMGRSP